MSHFKHLKFPKVNEVIKKASFDHGKKSTELENLFATYCGAAIQSNQESDEISERKSDTVIASLENNSAKNSNVYKAAPLELKDLLAHGKSVDYTILDKMKMFLQKLFRSIKMEDPERILLEKERDKLLKELWTSILEDSDRYFSNIKGKIVDSYIEEHIALIEAHQKTLLARYKHDKEEIDMRMQFWQSSIGIHRTMADGLIKQIESLNQLQVRLGPLYRV